MTTNSSHSSASLERKRQRPPEGPKSQTQNDAKKRRTARLEAFEKDVRARARRFFVEFEREIDQASLEIRELQGARKILEGKIAPKVEEITELSAKLEQERVTGGKVQRDLRVKVEEGHKALAKTREALTTVEEELRVEKTNLNEALTRLRAERAARAEEQRTRDRIAKERDNLAKTISANDVCIQRLEMKEQDQRTCITGQKTELLENADRIQRLEVEIRDQELAEEASKKFHTDLEAKQTARTEELEKELRKRQDLLDAERDRNSNLKHEVRKLLDEAKFAANEREHMQQERERLEKNLSELEKSIRAQRQICERQFCTIMEYQAKETALNRILGHEYGVAEAESPRACNIEEQRKGIGNG